jgi:hypothetical protein
MHVLHIEKKRKILNASTEVYDVPKITCGAKNHMHARVLLRSPRTLPCLPPPMGIPLDTSAIRVLDAHWCIVCFFVMFITSIFYNRCYVII